ncbi:MAG: ATP-binding cassette domain-containing protein, partial [Candidatus Binatia bacterium]
MAAVAAQNVTKIFGQGDSQVIALKDAQLSIEPGEIVALMGPSGSGKTTLLRALSLIDPPTAGQIAIGNEVVFDGERVLTDDRKLRRQRMGIIFQAYNLI